MAVLFLWIHVVTANCILAKGVSELQKTQVVEGVTGDASVSVVKVGGGDPSMATMTTLEVCGLMAPPVCRHRGEGRDSGHGGGGGRERFEGRP